MEILVSLSILALLGTILLPTFRNVLESNSRTGRNMVLTGAVAAARSVAAREGNSYAYPVSLAADLAAIDARYVAVAASGRDEVSVHRAGADRVFFAMWSEPGVCIVVIDNVDTETQLWGVDTAAELCDAQNVELTEDSVVGTMLEPTEITM
jgi:type II secretory pathway pseudopilin PulG